MRHRLTHPLRAPVVLLLLGGACSGGAPTSAPSSRPAARRSGAIPVVMGAPRTAPRPDVAAFPPDLHDLAVPGWRPAVVGAPWTEAPPPHRLVPVLHGNLNRPEWDCLAWQASVRPHGWVLCPRGIPRTDVDPRLDRWTYESAGAITRELEAGVVALEARFPGAVRRDDAWMVGFSLGAILAPAVVRRSRLSFSALILAEGGADVAEWQARRLARGGIRAVALVAGEHTGWEARAQEARRTWTRAGVPARVFVMPGTGHRFSADLDPLGAEVVAFLRAATASAPTRRR